MIFIADKYVFIIYYLRTNLYLSIKQNFLKVKLINFIIISYVEVIRRILLIYIFDINLFY